MKNFVKKAGAWFAVALIIGMLAVPAMAATGAEFMWSSLSGYSSPSYMDFDLNVARTGNYSGTLWLAMADSVGAGSYVVEGEGLSADQWSGNAPIVLTYMLVNNDSQETALYEHEFGVPFVVPEGYSAMVVAQSLEVKPVMYEYIDDPEPVGGFYYTVRELLQFYFYGDAELAPEHILTLNCLSTAAVLAIVVMPFVLVYFVIKLISGR